MKRGAKRGTLFIAIHKARIRAGAYVARLRKQEAEIEDLLNACNPSFQVHTSRVCFGMEKKQDTRIIAMEGESVAIDVKNKGSRGYDHKVT